jgi:hypothetical protein
MDPAAGAGANVGSLGCMGLFENGMSVAVSHGIPKSAPYTLFYHVLSFSIRILSLDELGVDSFFRAFTQPDSSHVFSVAQSQPHQLH